MAIDRESQAPLAFVQAFRAVVDAGESPSKGCELSCILRDSHVPQSRFFTRTFIEVDRVFVERVPVFRKLALLKNLLREGNEDKNAPLVEF